MRFDLIITESPGKERALSSLLEDEKTVFRVASCMGRLYELDPIDVHTFFSEKSKISWTPIDHRKVSYLKEQIKKADHIWISSDPDIEGEVIAWQIEQLAKHAGKSNDKISRIELTEITREAVTEAFGKNKKINTEKALGGIARRIFDNFSRFGFDEEDSKKYPYIKSAHGRVTSPVLESIGSKPIDKYVVQYTRPGLSLPFEITLSSNDDLDKTLRLLDRLPPPVFEKVKVESAQFVTEGLDYATLIKLITDVTEQGIEEAHNNLQDLYESGEISYFRSDNRNLTAKQKHNLSASFSEHGVDNLTFPVDDQSESVQAGHSAIIPLKRAKSISGPIDGLTPKDQILRVIWKYWSLHSQEREIKSTTGELMKDAVENRAWNKLIKEGRGAFNELQLSNSRGGWSKYNPEFKPLGMPIKLERHGDARVKRISPDRAVLARMTEVGVGRPSTLVRHSSKISRAFLTHGKINSKAQVALKIINKTMPGMTDPELMKKIESDLHRSKSEKEVVESISKSLHSLGVSFKEGDRVKRNFEHTINW